MSKLIVENVQVSEIENQNGVNLATLSADGRVIFNGTLAIPIESIPSWSSSSRPSNPSNNNIGYNTTIRCVEQYINSKWVKIQKFDVDIVRHGLVMFVDAANPNSYPGTGSFWRDLSGKANHFFLRNIDFIPDEGGGVFQCNGSSTSYAESVTLNMANRNYTIMGASRYTGLGGNARGRIINARSNNWLMGHWSNSVTNYYAEGWVSSVQSGGSDNNWRIYAATGSVDSDQYQLYVNGVSSSGPNTGGSQGPNGLRAGVYQNFSEVTNGRFGFIMAYDRVLSLAEIQQNYNVFRSRYGLT